MRAALITAMIASGCIREAAFECTSDPQCTRAGVQGTCEPVGFCSFPDATCGSGRRFGDASGTYTQQCVGDAGDGLLDGGITVPTGLGCPISYAALTGLPGHVYRRLGTTNSWHSQMAACQADGANVYLAIPDNASELQGILTLAATNSWVGVSDIVIENRFVTVLERSATFLPWGDGQPDNSAGGSDCVLALGASATYDDRRCSNGEVAVCECEP